MQIARHNENIESLQIQTEQLNEAVENRTSEARKGLLRYRELKHQAALALQEVATGYQNAQSLFRQGEKLMLKLKAVKVEHDQLCRDAIRQAQTQPDQAKDLICRLKTAREQLRKLYDEIENIRAESLTADCEGSLV